MWLALPVAAFVAVTVVLRRRGVEWREALLAAATFCGAYLLLVTELLSLPRWLSRAPIAGAWALLLVGAGLVARRLPRAPAAERGPPLTTLERVLLAGAGLVALALTLATIFAAPNTWDAMMYHLPRVVRWLDERSVAFYPTIDLQQLEMPPWQEYAMLHLHALWGGDRFDSAVSLICALGCALAASRIAAMLGARRLGQILAAIFTLTIPQGVLCASNAKNDWALAFWMVLAAWATLRWRERPGPLTVALGGLAVGLAIASKGTAFILLPFLLLGLAASWGRAGWRRFAVWAPIFALLCLLPSVPLAVRNHRFSGKWLAGSHVADEAKDPHGRDDFGVKRISVRGTAAGVLRFAALHMSTPSNALNRRIAATLSSTMRAFGADPDDPGAIMWTKTSHVVHPFGINAFIRHEILTGNPWHSLLLLAALVGLLRRPRVVPALWLGAAVAACFVAVGAYLRWQPFWARVHLPLFAVGGALVGLWLDRWPRALAAAGGALLLLLSLPYALKNDLRPLVPARGRATSAYATTSVLTEPRDHSYFFDNHKDITATWIEAARAVNATGCRDVGLDSDKFYTYPMLALLDAGVERRVRYLAVRNRTARLPAPTEPPCAVVCLHCAGRPDRLAPYAARGTPQIIGDIAIFR